MLQPIFPSYTTSPAVSNLKKTTEPAIERESWPHLFFHYLRDANKLLNSLNLFPHFKKIYYYGMYARVHGHLWRLEDNFGGGPSQGL